MPPISNTALWDWFSLGLIINGARYLIIMGGVFAVAMAVVLWVAPQRKIQLKPWTVQNLAREAGYSVLTLVVFSIVMVGYMMGHSAGIIRFLSSKPTTASTIVEVSYLIIAHDTYFYWTHRAMHHRRLFRFFHSIHHRSHSPTAFAGYSFSWAEAAVQASYIPLIQMLLPAHLLSLGVFVIHMAVRNAHSHCGVEMFPAGANRNVILRQITSTTFHDMHHATMRGNYGLYFNWWDRIMGTTHPQYLDYFIEVTERLPQHVPFPIRIQPMKVGAVSPTARQ